MERRILREHGNQLATLERATLVDDAQPEVFDAGIQREAEQEDLQHRRHDERDREPPISPDLPELLQRQRPETPAEDDACEAAHVFTCMRRMERQASV